VGFGPHHGGDVNRTIFAAEANYGPRLTQLISVGVLDKKILIVDDVVDTGKSVMFTKPHLI
jgi:hypoxanthine phosphoribosyltransferase